MICCIKSVAITKFQNSIPDVQDLIAKICSPKRRVQAIIVDALFGIGKVDWDSPDDMWQREQFIQVLHFTEVI